MKINLLILFALFITFLSAQNLRSEDGILLLNHSTFAQPLSRSRYVLILFYESEADKSAITEFVETGNQLKELYSGVKLARIEGSTNKTRTDMYKVTSYPALRLFINDGYTPAVYEGEFKAKAIIDWMTSKIAELIVDVKTIEEAEKIVTSEENVAFYFGSKEASAYLYLLDAISNLGVSNTDDDEDLVFATASDAMILEHFELVSDETSLIVFRDYDEERSIYPVPFTAESMRSFLNARKYAAVMPFNTRALTRLNNKKENGIILFQAASEDKELSKAFKVVAGEFRDMIAFIEIGGSQKNQLAKRFDLNANQYPAVGIVSGNKRFLLDRKLSDKNLKIFLVNYLSDNLVPYEKKAPKEPKLKEGYDGDVKVLEKSNFKNFISTEESDVLVEFYSPHCGHCTHFAPHYAALATKLKSVEGLILAKYDATKPRPEGVKIKYFPQLMYYRKDDKENPIEYEGNRQEDHLIKFIKKHATVSMKGF